MRRFLLCLVWVLQYPALDAQNVMQWPLYWNSFIDFKNDTVTIQRDVGFAYDPYASVSDCSGNILFYSNGREIYNRQGLMQNGGLQGWGTFNFAAGDQCEPGVLAVPQPGHAGRYYVFYWGDSFYYVSKRCKYLYALVDMNLNGGLGAVLGKDSLLCTADSLSLNMVFTKHANNTDYWLVVSTSKKKALSFRITPGGIDKKSIPSNCFFGYRSGVWNNFPQSGDCVFSNDGRHLICSGIESSTSTLGSVLRYNFNRSTGVLSNPFILLKHSDISGLRSDDIAISPNDSFVFVMCNDFRNGNPPNYDYLYQCNRFTGSFRLQGRLLGIELGVLRLGPDNRIYGLYASLAGSTLYQIPYPDKWGYAKNWRFIGDAHTITTRTCAVPRQIRPVKPMYFRSPHETQSCGDTLPFYYWGDTSYKRWVLFFGDGDSAEFSTLKKGLMARHKYAKQGKYVVKLRAYDAGTCVFPQTYTDTVQFKQAPVFTAVQLQRTGRSCQADTWRFQVQVRDASILSLSWGDGSGDTLLLNQDSQYSIRLQHVYQKEAAYSLMVLAGNKNLCPLQSTLSLKTAFLPRPAFGWVFPENLQRDSAGGHVRLRGCAPLLLPLADTAAQIAEHQYNWGNGISGSGKDSFWQIAYSKAGVYQAVVLSRHQSGCFAADTFVVQLKQTPAAAFGLADTEICGSNGFFVLCKPINPAQDSVQYRLYSGADSTDVFVTDSLFRFAPGKVGSYPMKLKAVAASGCHAEYDTQLRIWPRPDARIYTPDSSLCMHDAGFVIGSDTMLKARHHWLISARDTSTDRAAFFIRFTYPHSEALRHIAIADSSGCRDTAYLQLTVYADPQGTVLVSDTLVCAGDSVFFIRTDSSASMQVRTLFSGGSSITWQGKLGSSWQQPARVAVRHLRRSAEGCADSIVQQLTVAAASVFSIRPTDVCVGLRTAFYPLYQSRSSYPITGSRWRLNGNPASQDTVFETVFGQEGSEQLQLTLTDAAGCVSSDTAQIQVHTIPVADMDIARRDLLDYLFISRATPSAGIQWRINGTAIGSNARQDYLFSDTGTYALQLLASDAWGCADTATRRVYIYRDIRFYFPNALHPDGDGMNEDFGPEGLHLAEEMELMVFNRWGEMVFSTRDLQQRWTPRKGDVGNFVWICNVRDLNHQWHKYKGQVMVVE